MINSFDIETFIDDNNFFIPYCICFILKKKKYFFYYNEIEKESLIIQAINKIFMNIDNNVLIYVHNLNFDGSLIIVELIKANFLKFECFIYKMNIFSIKVFFNNKKIEFKCSYKLLPYSLKEIANNFNLKEKLPFPYLFSKKENLFYIGDAPSIDNFKNEEEYEKFLNLIIIFNFKEYSILYCIRDVEITSMFVEILLNLIKDFKISMNKIYSAPSLSFNIFLKRFNNNKIKVDNDSLFDEIIRKSYYGGRCEVYGNPFSHEKIFHYDFSGMYAQCMIEKFGFGNGNVIYENFDLNIPGFYYIEYESNINIPVLPHHSKNKNKLMFVNGINEGCYWFEEILLFLKHDGKILKIKYGYIFEKYDTVFDNFVLYFNEIKKKSKIHKKFGKLIINSLYGRFGMSQIDTYSFFIEKKKFYEIEDSLNIISLKIIENVFFIEAEINEELLQFLNIKKKKNKNNVSIASAITSKARIKLYNAQNAIIKAGGRMLYSDTDSLFVAFERNIENEKHGEVLWKNSKKDMVIDDAVFVSAKTYGYIVNKEFIVKVKGFSYNTVNFNELKEKFYNNNSDHIIVKKEKQIFKKNFILEEKILDKTIELYSYDKRKFIDNKKKTIPLVIKNFSYE